MSMKDSNLALAPCDFCNSKLAVLFCRADSAKLCLFCDHQVHSANALSLRHLRSQICGNCRAEPVSVRCCTENLMLCQDCDWDSHYDNSSVSSLHERSSVEGFTGCPSLTELATFFDLKGDDLVNMGSRFGVSEPKQSCSVLTMSTDKKYKQDVYEQLEALGKKDLNGNGGELGPGTPPSTRDQQGYTPSLEVENIDDEKSLHQQTTFTSLLNFPDHMNLRDGNCSVADSELVLDWDPSYPRSQFPSNTATTEESNNTLLEYQMMLLLMMLMKDLYHTPRCSRL